MKHLRLNCSGQSALEFVLISPLLFLLIVFIWKLSELALLTQKVEYAAYYAARSWSQDKVKGSRQYNPDDINQLKAEVIENRVKEMLGDDAWIEIVSNEVRVYKPYTLEIRGLFLEQPFTYTLQLAAKVKMEDEPLQYGGGRWE